MFRTISLSIFMSLARYTQQQVHVIQALLTVCQRDQDTASKRSQQDMDITVRPRKDKMGQCLRMLLVLNKRTLDTM